MQFKCPECQLVFSRKDNMIRHLRNMHSGINHAYPPQGMYMGVGAPPPPPQGMYMGVGAPPPPPPQGMYIGVGAPPHPPPPPPQEAQGPRYTTLPVPREENMVFHHPFTMMISGPTACGKTTMVKDLLQNHESIIQPDIHRIVWLYKRWQPLYTVIERTVVPKVRFIQGIPNDLDDDEFFDPRINNVLVLDDLFSEAGKDKRITDLFTEGSHHRSFSVISINQNLFGNKDPTQRRNCHYLVLFNNPTGKQSMMTLARQMYPGQTDKFMNMFWKAIKRPYGYLLVDLKPFTPENDRLKYGIKWKSGNGWTNQIHFSTQNPINQPDKYHFTEDDRSMQTGQGLDKIPPPPGSPATIQSTKRQTGGAMTSCDDCGIVFENIHDLQNHVKRWCQEGFQKTVGRQEGYGVKRPFHPDSEEEDDEMVHQKRRIKRSDDTIANIDPWDDIVEEAFERCRSRYDSKVNALMDEDSEISQEEAEKAVYRAMRETYRLAIMNALGHKLMWCEALLRDRIYNAIKKKIDHLMDKEGFDFLEAIKDTVTTRKFILDPILDKYETAGVDNEEDSRDEDAD